MPTAGRRPDELRRSLRIVLEDPSTTQVVVAADVGANGPLPKVPSDKRVRVIRVPADTGTPDERGQRAREFALEYAEADVVLALDDDVLPERGLVTGHALQHAGAEGTVVVGYMPVSWHDLPFRWRPAARYYSRSYEAACSRFEVCPGAILEGLWGGNFSVRRADWALLPKQRAPLAATTATSCWGLNSLEQDSKADSIVVACPAQVPAEPD